MAEKLSRISECQDVSAAFEESEEYRDPAKLVRLITADPSVTSVKARIWKAAKLLGLDQRRVKAFWYGEARVDFAEMDRLREIAEPEWEAEQLRKAREQTRVVKHDAARIRAKGWAYLSTDANQDRDRD